MSEQFENMLHSLCFAYADKELGWGDREGYDDAYAKLVERDRVLLEAIRDAVKVLEVARYDNAAMRLESVLKELGEG